MGQDLWKTSFIEKGAGCRAVHYSRFLMHWFPTWTQPSPFLIFTKSI
jgi:hypothetical protein